MNCEISTPRQATPKKFYRSSDSSNEHFSKLTKSYDGDFFEIIATKQLSDSFANYSFEINDGLNKAFKDLGFDFTVECDEPDFEDFFRILLNYHSNLLGETDQSFKVNIEDSGFGISQLLNALIPLVRINYSLDAEELVTLPVLLEEPEVHLHPEMQIKLINFIIDKIAGKPGYTEKEDIKQVILDTHSEVSAYAVLDRISRSTNGELGDEQLPLTSEQVQFLKVEYLPDEKYSIVHPISAGRYGTFSPPWPGGFFKLDDLD